MSGIGLCRATIHLGPTRDDGTDVKLRGRLGDVAGTDFALRTIKNDRMTEPRVPHDQLRPVRILGKAKTRGRVFDETVRRAHLVMGLAAGGLPLGFTVYAIANAR